MSADRFQELVDDMVAMRIPRDKAEAAARKELKIPAPADPDTVRTDTILEKTEQTEIMKLFRAYGFTVRSLSQARASKQAPGLSDLWVTHNTLAIAFWWESKRQVGGALSPAQETFRDDCARCGVGYGTGDRYAAAEHLITLGLAQRVGMTLEPTRQLQQTG